MLHWYIENYGGHRKGYRVPLSAAELDYLLAPVTLLTVYQPVPRIALSYYLEHTATRTAFDLSSPDNYRQFVYWWAVEKAPTLSVEDCLVPDYFVTLLRTEISNAGSSSQHPLSEFATIYYNLHPELHSVPQSDTEGAAATYAHLLMLSAGRPDYLRYIPATVIDDFLGSATTPGALDAIVTRLLRATETDNSQPAHTTTPTPTMLLHAALHASGFDLERRAFRSIDSTGHRIHSIQLQRPSQVRTSDRLVQVIGPFNKASGLGQACRLAAAILDKTDFEVLRVGFDMDNPAPAHNAATFKCHDISLAPINLIHLNGESVPLAFAYLPDAFTDAYNIGYFYWELDAPASAHYLAMDLLDEIWVASDFGVGIYRPHTRKPVVNVGMSFEAATGIDRAEARLMLQNRCGINADDFVFLATFDSFSFVQRKNPYGVIRAFRAAFAQHESNRRLLLKTHNAARVTHPAQLEARGSLEELCRSDDRIVLIDETMPFEKLLQLERGSDAYVSLHRSEGWGFGMIEAMALGVPVICTGYSGNMEFCSDDTAWLVDYEMVAVRSGEYLFEEPGRRWAEPSVEHAARQMKAVTENADLRGMRASTAQRRVYENFSLDAVARRFQARLEEICSQRPSRSRN
jgi:glycosyltransferase involved in cell wall biosynthesis